MNPSKIIDIALSAHRDMRARSNKLSACWQWCRENLINNRSLSKSLLMNIGVSRYCNNDKPGICTYNRMWWNNSHVARKIKGIWFSNSSAAYLHSLGFAWNRLRRVRSSLVSWRKARGENERSAVIVRPQSELAAVDLIPRSRATHINGFLDPNRRRTIPHVRLITRGEQSQFTHEGVDAREIIYCEMSQLISSRQALFPIEWLNCYYLIIQQWDVYDTGFRKWMLEMIVWINH